MKEQLIAARYAQALCAAVSNREQLEAVLESFTKVAETVLEHSTVAGALVNPSIELDIRERVLDEILTGTQAPPIVRNGFFLLLRRGRLRLLPHVIDAFTEAADRELGRATAYVTTAIPLTPENEAKIQDSLSRLTGRTVHLVKRVSPDVLGGVRARIGDKVYDSTVRTRLRRLRERLTSGELN